ncbi:MAG: PilN domain-containing protein [Actinomycetota bacterium]|nr:hypothetical protein [Actinomycetota bacterium]
MAARRINLLPTEVLVRKRIRRQTGLLATGVVLFLLILAGIWFIRQGQLHDQLDQLDAANAQVATLQAKVAKLQEFAALDQTVKSKEATLASAMAGDVAWSRLLIELSMIIPGDSWLTAMSGTAGAAAPGTARTVAPAGSAPALGSLNFTVVTFDFPGVSKWITRLQELKSLQNIWVPAASKGAIGDRTVINYSSTSDLSQEAASKRFQGPR